ncbi:indolepyruvate oxidoreductase subunit beta [Desulfurobacterium atlanticum]|uniref:Indolepyruvate ferredoxin oxidoreductase beta subunit n=1 Tax=Desulfurobacterium atlanticum TaxID=240169 RepID=A0A238ZME8_9BACT|nr:indolepyruvate oxidoreductase subunit beta [Desulfurobacterium atlanticum]SNR84626.1 indolepyruvate ferredoxin oxidoreductase beta subunit [Desulfurobacterium atlanticum]
MKYQIVLTGVGGQGTIFLVKLLAQCALNKNIPFIGTETHGMAQKGGTVISYLKIGDFYAPLVGKGQADIIIGLYPTETLRFLEYLKKDGKVITNVTDNFNLPKMENLNIFTVNGSRLAVNGEINPKSLNVFILGYTLQKSPDFPFTKEEIEDGIKAINAKFADTNIKAFNKGFYYRENL